MLAVRDGDLDRLGHLFEEHHRQLYNYYLKQVRSPELSEDFVQEVFFRMLKYRHTYREDGKFMTWMYSIAHNVKADYFRKAKHRQDFTDEIDGLVSDQPDPSEVTEQSDQHELLHRAMEQLSDERREVLILSRFQNLKYEEISEILGCPVGTVKARVFRAIRDLKTFFDEQTSEAAP
jgi:RNA polymerase sigma-70 factor (ECF subfamily)